MTDSFIVTMLRSPTELELHIRNAAADVIDRLRKERECRQLELENARYQNNLLIEKWRQIEMERDKARREICETQGYTVGAAHLEAERRGWDCYKENIDE